MTSMKAMVIGLAASAALLAQQAAPQHDHQAPGKLGSVHFQTTCAGGVQAPFDHAMALLHSFEFGDAIAAFDGVQKADPACGIAWWGIALSRWGNPFNAAQRTA